MSSAARFLGAAERLFAEVDPDELESQETIRDWAAEALGGDTFEASRTAGADTPVDELVPVPT